MTLAQTAFGQQSLLKQALMVLGGSLFIALAAQVTVPMYPVPMTLQTLAVLMVGLSFGPRLGALTVLAYLAEGAAGLPVFANAGNGAAFFGPTAGFLFGFVAMAWIAGLAAGRSLGVALLACLLASVALYIPGTAWPFAVAGAFGLEAGWVNLSAAKIWGGFVAPFLLGDLVKTALAAILVTGATAALAKRA